MYDWLKPSYWSLLSITPTPHRFEHFVTKILIIKNEIKDNDHEKLGFTVNNKNCYSWLTHYKFYWYLTFSMTNLQNQVLSILFKQFSSCQICDLKLLQYIFTFSSGPCWQSGSASTAITTKYIVKNGIISPCFLLRGYVLLTVTLPGKT